MKMTLAMLLQRISERHLQGMLWPLGRLAARLVERLLKANGPGPIPSYNPSTPEALYDYNECIATFPRVGDRSYDQALAVRPFCPDRGRLHGCFRCQYCPPQYAGWTHRQYIIFKDGRRRGGVRTQPPGIKETIGKTYQELVHEGVMKPV